MKRNKGWLLGLIVLLACRATGASGDTGPWAYTLPTGEQHWYQAYTRPLGITWIAASNAAHDLGGYLATVRSPGENQFVFQVVNDVQYWHAVGVSNVYCGPWIGGVQPAGSPEPDQGWQWITGESFVYTNWSPGAPDNNLGAQNVMALGGAPDHRVPSWDDFAEGSLVVHGFIVEYDESPCTVGLQQWSSNALTGYTLYAPLTDSNTFLVDMAGRVVRQWVSDYMPGNACYLLTNGCLLRTATVSNETFVSGGRGGRVERFAWDGTLEWAFEYSSTNHLLHHDIEYLPNGNILMLAWENKTAAQAVQCGRDPSMLKTELWAEHIIEVMPTGSFGGTIEWEWHAWDHLVQDFNGAGSNYGVVADHPERININFSPDGNIKDWCHGNGLSYNPDLDQVILSLRNLSEFWVIDHSTTTEEAATTNGGLYGKGGDLLYRWGNPASYDRGTSTDQHLFVQHNAHWIEEGLPGAGNILVFNNGDGRPGGNFTTIDELAPPINGSGVYTAAPGQAYGPTSLVWQYVASPPTNFYASFISGAHRLANSNTMICDGPAGHFFEVTGGGETVWSYINPVESGSVIAQGDQPSGSVNTAFRCYRFPTNYAGFNGQSLTSGAPVETYTFTCDFDGDGMADQWEVVHGLSPSVSSDGSEDADGDGMCNADEYRANTDPRNANDWLHVMAMQAVAGTGDVMLASSTSRWYSLEYSTNLLEKAWYTLPGASATQGNGGLLTLAFPTDATGLYYRIRVSFPVPQ